jgi:hypothetical protein
VFPNPFKTGDKVTLKTKVGTVVGVNHANLPIVEWEDGEVLAEQSDKLALVSDSIPKVNLTFVCPTCKVSRPDPGRPCPKCLEEDY